MNDSHLTAMERLAQDSEELAARAQVAASASVSTGEDSTGSVRAALDVQGRVSAVTVSAGWRRRLGDRGLANGVVEATRDASMRRLTAWGEAFATGGKDAATTGRPPSRTPGVDGHDLIDAQRRLNQIAKSDLSEEDRIAALTGVLELFESIEQGIDEVAGQVQAVTERHHTGRDARRNVEVTVTGAGEVISVRVSPEWLRDADDTELGHDITAAFRSAYQAAAAEGVQKLIAGSRLGAAQRATQDPFGLARRLRIGG